MKLENAQTRTSTRTLVCNTLSDMNSVSKSANKRLVQLRLRDEEF